MSDAGRTNGGYTWDIKCTSFLWQGGKAGVTSTRKKVASFAGKLSHLNPASQIWTCWQQQNCWAMWYSIFFSFSPWFLELSQKYQTQPRISSSCWWSQWCMRSNNSDEVCRFGQYSCRDGKVEGRKLLPNNNGFGYAILWSVCPHSQSWMAQKKVDLYSPSMQPVPVCSIRTYEKYLVITDEEFGFDKHISSSSRVGCSLGTYIFSRSRRRRRGDDHDFSGWFLVQLWLSVGVVHPNDDDDDTWIMLVERRWSG